MVRSLEAVFGLVFLHSGVLDFASAQGSFMITGKIVIRGAVGLHARPAADFVREAEKFKSKVRLAKDGIWVNGKSILSILTLAAEKGSVVVLEVSGEDEKAAFKVLETRLKDDT